MTSHPWAAKSRQLRDEEDGISLIEMMVSLLLIAVALSAFASVLITSLRTTSRNEEQVNATALAQQVIEELQATDWESAGHYEDDLTSGSPGMDPGHYARWA